jgi:hypothetical protein
MITITTFELLAPETTTRRTLGGIIEETLFGIRFVVRNDTAAALFVIERLRRYEYDPATTKLTLWYSEPAPDPDYDTAHTAFPSIREVAAGATLTIETRLPVTINAAAFDSDGEFVPVQFDFSTLTQIELHVRWHTSYLVPADLEWATANALNQQIHDWGTETTQTFNRTFPFPNV